MACRLLLDVGPKRRQALFPRSSENEFPKSHSQTNLQTPSTINCEDCDHQKKNAAEWQEKSLPPFKASTFIYLYSISMSNSKSHASQPTPFPNNHSPSFLIEKKHWRTLAITQFKPCFWHWPALLLLWIPIQVISFLCLFLLLWSYQGLVLHYHHLQTLHRRRTWTDFLWEKSLQLGASPHELIFFIVTSHQNKDWQANSHSSHAPIHLP